MTTMTLTAKSYADLMAVEMFARQYGGVSVSVEQGIPDITMASENALAKDWLLPEEDKAWDFL